MKCSFTDHFGIFDKWVKIEEAKDYIVFQCPGCKEKKKIRINKGKFINPDMVTAIYEADDGTKFPVNAKGNIVNKNPYKNDSKGWKMSNRKISNYDSHNKKVKEVYR